MARTDAFIVTNREHDYPNQVSLPSAANQLFPGGTLITRNASDQAFSPATADVSGFPAVAVAEETQDNRTGSELGGAAGALTIHGKCGVYGFPYVTGDGVPKRGSKMYVVDNQTVSVAATGGRGFAFICADVATDPIDGVAKAYGRIGPDQAWIT